MKYKPFIEILDFDKELKEYKLLCRNKSKKFTYYLDWKNYISSLISKIKDDDDLENLKFFCRNRERSMRNIPSLYLNIIILFLTISFDRFVVEINVWIYLLIFLFCTANIVKQNNSYEKENYFYSDILEIIDAEGNKNNGVNG